MVVSNLKFQTGSSDKQAHWDTPPQSWTLQPWQVQPWQLALQQGSAAHPQSSPPLSWTPPVLEQPVAALWPALP